MSFPPDCFSAYTNEEQTITKNEARFQDKEGAVQKCAILVGPKNVEQIRLLSLSEVSMQQRTSLPKFEAGFSHFKI